MFPVGDDNPQINTPYVTYGIIALNILAWLLLQGAGFGEQLTNSVCNYGLVPSSLFADSLTEVAQGRCANASGWSGVISSMFMHGGWMHLIGNMWFLYIFGDNIEDSMGPVRFAIFYLLCGLIASAAQVLSEPMSVIPMVGASGAIGGVMGAYIMLYPKVKVKMGILIFVIFFTVRIPAVLMLGYWIGMQVIEGYLSIGSTGGGTAFWAHVGGFVGGAALVWLFKDDELLLNHPFRGWHQKTHPANVWDDPSNRQ